MTCPQKWAQGRRRAARHHPVAPRGNATNGLLVSGPAPFPRPGPHGGLTITTRDSLCTDGSPQPPPQQLSSKGAAILSAPTSATRKYFVAHFPARGIAGAGREAGRKFGVLERFERLTGGFQSTLSNLSKGLSILGRRSGRPVSHSSNIYWMSLLGTHSTRLGLH